MSSPHTGDLDSEPGETLAQMPMAAESTVTPEGCAVSGVGTAPPGHPLGRPFPCTSASPALTPSRPTLGLPANLHWCAGYHVGPHSWGLSAWAAAAPSPPGRPPDVISERQPISLPPPPALTAALWLPPGGWKLWSLWGECTRDCGGGLQTRTRTCLPARGTEGGGCEGVLEEGRLCNRKACGRECAGREGGAAGRVWGGAWPDEKGAGLGRGQVEPGIQDWLGQQRKGAPESGPGQVEGGGPEEGRPSGKAWKGWAGPML